MEKNNEFKYLLIEDGLYLTKLTKKFEKTVQWVKPDARLIKSFIPGTILSVVVNDGDSVTEGQELLVLEAMKMANSIIAPFAGKIKKVHVQAGEKIPKGRVMIEME